MITPTTTTGDPYLVRIAQDLDTFNKLTINSQEVTRLEPQKLIDARKNTQDISKKVPHGSRPDTQRPCLLCYHCDQ